MNILANRCFLSKLIILSVHASDLKSYTDVDECTEELDNCAHNCNNMAGNYTCSCDSGYRLASDGHSCDGE